MRPLSQDVNPPRSSRPTPDAALERNIGRYLAGRVLLAVAGFASIPLLTRAIGVEEYGRLSLWMTVALWAPQLVGGWLQQSTLRYHRAFQLGDEYADYVATARLALRRVALLSGALVVAAVPLFAGTTVGEKLLLGGLAAATALNTYFVYVALSEQKSSLVVAADVARTAAPALLIGAHVLLAGHLHRTGALFYFLAGMSASALFLGLVLRREGAPSGHYAPEIMRRLVAFGLPMGVWVALSSGQVLIGRFVLQSYGLHAELGVFTAYQDFFSKVGAVLFIPVTYALHGQVMALWAEGSYLYARSAVHRAYLYQGLMGAGLLAAVLAGHRFVNRALFGAHVRLDSIATELFLLLVTVAVVLGNFSLISHKGLELGERTRTMTAYLVLSMVANLALAWCLTPTLGVYGVAVGALAGNAGYLLLTHTKSQRFLRLAVEAAR